jgi:anti-sigma factor RsiW
MRCRKAHKLLSLRMDGRLSARRAADLELHLASCASCASAAEQIQRSWDALAQLPAPSPAPDDWPAIEAGVEAWRRRWVPAWLDLDLVPTRSAAAAFLVAMAIMGGTGGLLLGRALPSSSQTAPLETQLVAETLGDLPWNSPASGLEPVLYAGRSAEGQR